MILPKPEYTTKKFMWQCVIGLKKYMTVNGDLNGTKYDEHKPGFTIRENSIKYWIDSLHLFPGWEKFVPDPYICKIKNQTGITCEKREYVAFDTKYLLSVFKTLDKE